MELIDRLNEISRKIPQQLPLLQTEEATKNALVMPFISALGYNVFDPTEVIPEFTADVGIKKSEKVDYAVLRAGEPIILFECKTAQCNLDDTHISQLYRYFSVTPARFGILTNGVQYRFFSDLEEPNKMDDRPFLELDMQKFEERHTGELKKFTKQGFDLDNILATASDLKYTKGIRRLLIEEWANPSEDFVRLLAGRVYSGRMTQAAKEQFTEIVKRAFHEFVNSRVNERLKSALERTTADTSEKPAEGSTATEHDDDRVVTTSSEELEGFYVVKAIVADVLSADRVYIRDTLSYCSVLVDDNNRKPICRLFFEGSTKYIGLFDENKNCTRERIESVNDLFKFSDKLRETAQRYVEAS